MPLNGFVPNDAAGSNGVLKFAEVATRSGAANRYAFDVSEETVIEFGTSREVLFASNLPLEFDDTVRLKNVDGSLDTEAKVVAVQLGEGKSAVAVRFCREVANWIIKSER